MPADSAASSGKRLSRQKERKKGDKSLALANASQRAEQRGAAVAAQQQERQGEGLQALSASAHDTYGNTLVLGALSGREAGPGQVLQGAMALGAAGVAISDSVGGLFANSDVMGWMGALGGDTAAGAVDGAGAAAPSVSAMSISRHEDAPGGWSGDSVKAVNTAVSRGGRPLDSNLSGRLGAAFGGVDFSQVRVHTDAAAAVASRQIYARAFTVGTDVFFGEGQYSPETPAGQHLLAHELTHVQQHLEGRLRPGKSDGDGMNVSSPTDPHELEAEANAASVVGALQSMGSDVAAPGPGLDGPAVDAGGLEAGVEAAGAAAGAAAQVDQAADSGSASAASSEGAVVSRDLRRFLGVADVAPDAGGGGQKGSRGATPQQKPGGPLGGLIGGNLPGLGASGAGLGDGLLSGDRPKGFLDVGELTGFDFQSELDEKPDEAKELKADQESSPNQSFQNNKTGEEGPQGGAGQAVEGETDQEKEFIERASQHFELSREEGETLYRMIYEGGNIDIFAALQNSMGAMVDGMAPLQSLGADIDGITTHVREAMDATQTLRDLGGSPEELVAAIQKQVSVLRGLFPGGEIDDMSRVFDIYDQGLERVLGLVDQFSAGAGAAQGMVQGVVEGMDGYSPADAIATLAGNTPMPGIVDRMAQTFGPSGGGIGGVTGMLADQMGGSGSQIPGLSGAGLAVLGQTTSTSDAVRGPGGSALRQVDDSLPLPDNVRARIEDMRARHAAPTTAPGGGGFGQTARTSGGGGGGGGATTAVTTAAQATETDSSNEAALTTQQGGGGGGGAATGTGTGTGGGGGGAQISGAPTGGGGGGGGGGAAAPTPVTAGASAKESFENFSTAVPSVQAASYPSLGSNVDQGWTTEDQQFQDGLPEFTAKLTGGEADGETEVEADADQAEISDAVVGNTPVNEQPAPTVVGSFQGNVGAERSVRGLGGEATEEQKAAAATAAIRNISTTDGSIEVRPRPQPAIKLEGEQDPQRVERQRSEGMTQAETARNAARQAVIDGPGPDLVQPIEVDESTELEAITKGTVAGSNQLPEFDEFLSLGLPGDITAKFDEIQGPAMDAALVGARTQMDQAVTTRDEGQASEIEKAQADVEKQNLEAQTEQEARVAEARQGIVDEKDATLTKQQTELAKVDSEARNRQTADINQVRARVTADQAKITTEFDKAEADATRQVSKAEKDAKDEKARQEEEANNQSWWQKAVSFVADCIKAIAEAITKIFDAVRELVAKVLDAAKAFAFRLIDAACAFIKDVIKAYGEFLKFMVDNLLGSIFPGLAAALNEFIDNLVDLACKAVDFIGEKLKETITAICDAINEALKAISDAFNAAVDLVLAVAEAALTGNWSELLWKVLEAALKLCGINPEEFRAVLAQGEETIETIVKNPGAFVGNMISAAGQGFSQFGDNFLTHLQNGFVGWLTGALGEAGITLPETWDAMGVLSIASQVTGITPEYIEEKARKNLGDDNVDRIKFVMDWVSTAFQGGWGGVWEHVQDSLGNIYDSLVDQVKSFLMEKVIIAAVTKLATMFNPVGAIVQAVLTAWRLYEFLRDQINRIYAVVKSVVSSIADIAAGNIGGAANLVEGALANMVPVAIDLLAKLIGVSGVSKKVREVLTALHTRIDAAIDKLIEKVKGWFKPGKGKGDAASPSETQSTQGEGTPETTPADGSTPSADQQTQGVPGQVSFTTPRITMRDSQLGMVNASITASGRVKSTTSKPLDDAASRTASSVLQTKVQSVVAAKAATVGVTGLAGHYSTMAGEVKTAASGELSSSGVTVDSFSITGLVLPAEVQQAIDQAAANQVLNPDGSVATNGQIPAGQEAFIAEVQQKQSFTAGQHGHHIWVERSGDSFTPMVASTPTPVATILDTWLSQLNAKIPDPTMRSSLSGSIRSAQSGLRSLTGLLGNVGQCTKDADRIKVKQLIFDKEKATAVHLAVCFGTFSEELAGEVATQMISLGGSDPTRTSVVAGEALNITQMNDGPTFLARCASRGIPLTTAVSVLRDYTIGVMSGNNAKMAAAGEAAGQAMRAAGAMTTEKDGSHFWSGTKKIAEDEASATGGQTLEMTGGWLFDGLDFGKTSPQLGPLWDGLSRALAQGVSGVVQAHQYRGVRIASVFNRVERPELLELIRTGVVSRIEFHRYLKTRGSDGKPIWGDPVKKRDPKLQKVNTITCRSQGDIDAIEHWDFPESSPDTVGLA